MIGALLLVQLASSAAFVGHRFTGVVRLLSQQRGETGACSRIRYRRQHPPPPLNPGNIGSRGSLGVRTAARLWVGAGAIDGDTALKQRSEAGGSCAGATATNETGGPPKPDEGGAPAPTVPQVIGDIRRFCVDALRVQPGSASRDEQADIPQGNFVDLFRGSAPYIRAHQGAIMVVHMGGDVLDDPNFLSLMDDLGLLNLLGVRWCLLNFTYCRF